MKFQTTAIVLALALLSSSIRADEQDLGVLDPAAGTVKASVYPTLPACPGEHEISAWFVPFSVAPRFTLAQWLNVPATAKLSADPSFIDVTIPLGQLTPGTYTGAVFYRCDKCSAGGDCVNKVGSDRVRVEVAAPGTFGAAGADQNFHGLVNGQPVSIHDLTVNVIGAIKASSFMQLTGAAGVVQVLENDYADRAFTSNDLSDISFVKNNGITDPKNGRMSSKVEPIDDEDVAPGNGSYVRATADLGPDDEEIFIGVDVSLKGITEARQHPDDFYVFTIDGQMGVINRADFVHNLMHEALHASLRGKYNTAKSTGGRAACQNEEQEGFRVGNAAARALGLPEDTTVPGASYGGCANPNYPTQFPQLVPGQESTDPTRTAPKAASTPATPAVPTRTSALPVQNSGTPGHCRLEGAGLQCEGVPGYALACESSPSAEQACTLQGTKLKPPCSFGQAGWTCATPPPAVANCAGGSCRVEEAGSACAPEAKGVRCTALPAFGLECKGAGNCALTDPRNAAGVNISAALSAATQSADCERAAPGEFRVLAPFGGSALRASGGDPGSSLQIAFKRDLEAVPPTPRDRFLYQFAPWTEGGPRMTWPGAGSRAADLGSDALPQRGVVEVTRASTGLFTHGGHNYQLRGGSFASANLAARLGGDSPFDRDVRQRLSIDGAQYTSLLFDGQRAGVTLDALRAAGIGRVEANPCRAVLVPTDPNYRRTGRNGGNSWGGKADDQWAIKRVGYTDDETSAWRLVSDKSAPVVVAVIDSGLDWHHADLDPASLWRNADEIADNGLDDDRNGYVDDLIGWNFVGGDNRPWDYDGHGTFVTGIILARHNDAGIAGVAANARVMVLKSVGNFGMTRASWLAEAIVYAVDNGAKIINLSVGGAHESAMEQAALDYAHHKGVLVIAAAGNSGAELKDFGPGGHGSVLTIGATGFGNEAAPFSNFGDKVDLVAPGVEVLSLRARATDVNYRPWQDDGYMLGAYVVGDDKRYLRASGTSFSTPIVTATAALVLGNHPALTADQLASILTQTALDLGAPGRDASTGFGMVNPRAALVVAPDFRIVAQLSRVELVPAAAPAAVEVWGTIDATRFKRAWLQIGPGENPQTWRFVGQKLKLPVREGKLTAITLAEFETPGPWTVVVNVEDSNGVVKRGRFLVRIP